MIDFKDLKMTIQKICRSEQANNINERFKFSINTYKLEKVLNQKSDLHVMGFCEEIESRIPTVDDYQLLTEYAHKKEEIETIFDGTTQIATFLLYCDKNGCLSFADEDKNPIENKEIFEQLNKPELINKDLITEICINYPIYRTLIIRKFNKKRDKFEYSIYFRSNYNMITYIKSLKENGEFLSGEILESEQENIEE